MELKIEIGGQFFDVSTGPGGDVRARQTPRPGPRLVSVGRTDGAAAPGAGEVDVSTLRAELERSETVRADLQSRLERVFVMRAREQEALLGVVERFKPLVRRPETVRSLGDEPKSEEL